MTNNMLNYFKIGDIIYGYCNGCFGRDDYNAKICVHITPWYAVFEYLDREQGATILNISTIENDNDVIDVDVDEWKKSSNY